MALYRVSKIRTIASSPKRTRWILVAVWSTIIASSLAFNLVQIRQRTIDNVRVEATIAYEKDMLYQSWITGFGGVYVPTEEVGAPNPYLSEYPKRDLVTTDGLQLTLINPACMARQVRELFAQKTGTLGRMTSLNPLQPVNSPDTWERSALLALERGKTDTSSFEIIDNEEYFRLMKPLLVEQSCMTCHARQGYVVGDIRGGMSVSVPLAEQRANAAKSSSNTFLTYIFIWAIGMIGIGLACRRIEEKESSRSQAQEALRNANDNLESQVRMRTNELKTANELLEQDIAARRFVEENLRKLNRIVEQSPVSVVVTDLEGTIEYVNPFFIELTGYSAEEAVGTHTRILRAGDNPPNLYKGLWATITVGNTWRGEFHNKKKNGELYWEKATIGPGRNEQGEITHYIAIKEDITQRKATEEALERSEQKLSDFFNNAIEGFYRSNAEGILLYANPAFATIFGFDSTDEILGINLEKLYLTPDHREETLQAYEMIGEIRDHEIQMRRKDETQIWIRLSCTIMKDGDGIINGYEGIVTEITESKHLESERLKVQRLESIGLLAAGIGHDFNNFLMEILLNSTSGQIEASDHPNIRKIFATIENAVRKARSLTHQLLTISQNDHVKPTDCLIEPLLKEAVVFSLLGTPVKPLFDLAQNLHIVTVDVGQINQVISNLILNARQSMPEGGDIKINAMNIEVSDSGPIGPLKPGKYVQVSISDPGLGIDPTIINRIFDAYFSTKGEGSGLGLFSCFSILANHGGWITVSSEVGQGSVFTFFLPGKETQSILVIPPNEESINGSGRILIMDDEEEIRKTLAELLEFSGYEVDSASNGDMALEMHYSSLRSEERYCAVILDMTVSEGRGGMEIIEDIKKQDPQTKGIICSGYITDSVMHRYKDYGFDGVLQKPYSLPEVTSLLATLLDPDPADEPNKAHDKDI